MCSGNSLLIKIDQILSKNRLRFAFRADYERPLKQPTNKINFVPFGFLNPQLFPHLL